MGAGIRKEDTALKEKLNAAIAALAKAGKFDEITAKYPELVGQDRIAREVVGYWGPHRKLRASIFPEP